jgi:hypothetical protein
MKNLIILITVLLMVGCQQQDNYSLLSESAKKQIQSQNNPEKFILKINSLDAETFISFKEAFELRVDLQIEIENAVIETNKSLGFEAVRMEFVHNK